MSENFEKIKAAPLFDGIAETELPELLGVLEARSRRYAGGEIILNEGERTDSLGLVLSGSVLIVQDDFWGNRNILARITRGGIFAESFACTGERLTVGAQAESDCEIMRLKVEYVLKSCPKSCSAHSALVGNLIHELARKNLNFNSKLSHMGKRTTREKLLSYLSAQATKSGKNEFDIPFDRQQLADYLCVDGQRDVRSALRAQGRRSAEFKKSLYFAAITPSVRITDSIPTVQCLSGLFCMY